MRKKILLSIILLMSVLSAFCGNDITREHINLRNAPVDKSNIKDFGGMSFCVLPSGDSIDYISIDKFLKIDVAAYVKYNFKYVYLLHSSGKTNAKPQNGRLVIYYSDGRKVINFVVPNKDIGRAEGPEITSDNSLPVGRAKDGSVLYLSRFVIQYGASAGANPSIPTKVEFSAPFNWRVAGITLSSDEVLTTENYFFDPKIWKAIDTSDLTIKEGSALDLSKHMTSAPCGIDGRVIVGKSGKFEFEKKPGVPIRFKGTNLHLAWRFPVRENIIDPSAPHVPGDLIRTHADIDAYVKILKKQGYNAVRWRPAMRGKAEFESPYKLYPEIQDLYDYYIYALKREGVYIFYYLCSNDDGSPDYTWDKRQTIKMKMMLGDKQTRENWVKLAKMQLEHVNPYTGMALKDDPVVATLEYWNEFEIGAETPTGLTGEGKALRDKKFAEFLAKKYGTVEKFLADNPNWGQKKTPKDFSEIDLDFYASKSSKAYAHFVVEAMKDTHAFFEKVIRQDIGMKNVPIHQNNSNKRMYWGYLSADGGNYIAINSYFVHPSSYLLGARVSGASEFDDDAFFWRNTVTRRVAGMPMTVTEYQHCHFNKYKHEAALTFPAYSAFNDYDGLVVFNGAVAPKGGELSYFNVAENPILRANDFVNYFLFYRGDVSKSRNRVDLYCDSKIIENSNAFGNVPIEYTKISLMTGFALNFPTISKTAEANKKSPPSLKISPDAPFNTAKFAGELKAKGILPPDNISDPARGIYQSDTGEITLKTKERVMKVVTPKTEAIVMRSDTKGEKLGKLTVKSSSADAAIALSSLDGKPISESEHLVLTYNTDAIMSGFGVSKNRLYSTAWGTMPILIETGKLKLELKVDSNKSYSMWPLKLNGERMGKIDLKNEDGVLNIDLDSSNYPAIFFEIAADN